MQNSVTRKSPKWCYYESGRPVLSEELYGGSATAVTAQGSRTLIKDDESLL